MTTCYFLDRKEIQSKDLTKGVRSKYLMEGHTFFYNGKSSIIFNLIFPTFNKIVINTLHKKITEFEISTFRADTIMNLYWNLILQQSLKPYIFTLKPYLQHLICTFLSSIGITNISGMKSVISVAIRAKIPIVKQRE